MEENKDIEEQKEVMKKQDHLKEQSLENLDPSKITPLTPEVISRQATINIGTIGHVAHGKSTVVQAISGVQTVRFHNEKIRNITIKLGYANAKIYKCTNPDCKPPDCYKSYGSSSPDIVKCEKCETGSMKLLRHVSFVDCPGHDILMATMLNGVAVMDAALLLIAGNEPCPQPQTNEHLAAVEMMQLQNIIIIQNKIDIVMKDNSAPKQYEDIKKLVAGTKAENAPIIPISAQLKYNIEIICDYICRIPIPIRDFTSAPKLVVIRSFDVNKPGEEAENLKGGVAGGSIIKGVLRVGDEVEIRPGIIGKDKGGRIKCTPINTRVSSLQAEKNELLYAVPGGLIGVGLLVDPTLTRADWLVGHVLGHPGSLPDIFNEIDIEYYLLRRLLGVKSEGGKKKTEKIGNIQKEETLLVNIGSTSVGGRVNSVKAKITKLSLTKPVCTDIGEKIALSRRIGGHWRLIGWGKITMGYSPNQILIKNNIMYQLPRITKSDEYMKVP